MSSLDLTVGAVEVGVLISTVLYGVVGSQVAIYLGRDFKDPPFIRVMMWLICVIETFHTIVMWCFLYSLSVTHYGMPEHILDTPWSFGGIVVAVAVMSMTVQIFLAYRIAVLSGSVIVPVISAIGATFHSVLAFVMAGLALRYNSLAYFSHYKWIITTDFAFHAVVDVLNTASMSYFLLRQRSGFKTTRRAVDKLVLYTLETGLVTSLCSVAILTCFLTMESNFVFIAIVMIYPKLFSLVFLVSLTSRQRLRRDLSKGHLESVYAWSGGAQQTDSREMSTRKAPDNSNSTGRRGPVPEVRITTEVEMISSTKNFDY